jgi:ADP-heptose:LPS heptosyltransferase
MQENKKHMLVIKHGALGDLMQSIGVLMDIRSQYTDAEITFLTGTAYLQLMQRCPYIDHVIVDNRAPIWRVDQQFKLQKILQRQSFDLVIDLQNSDRSRMYRQFWFSKVKWIGRSADAEAPTSGLAGLITLLSDAGLSIQHAYHPDMSWMVGDISALLNKHGIGEDYIVLIPGSSSQHLDKRWPHYAALATALINKGKQVVVILGPEEADIGKQMPGHLVQGLNWFELAGVLNGATFVVGNDTGPSHIASYLNKAGLAIFGPTTSAARAEIGHRNFKTIEVDNLAALTVEQVLAHVITHQKSIL